MKSNRLAKTALTLACAFALPSALHAADLPAFPGAQGPGANATGGRGKAIYHVTNLNSDGPGSFRDAVSTDDRFIVFDVGGTIHLMPAGPKGWLKSAASNLTIAGETAPGDGITIKGQGIKFTGHNVIMRNLKVRPGMDQLRPGVATNDGITNYLQDSIIDHVSISWADDEGLSTSDQARNVTVQYALIGEVLNYHNHGFGALIATEHPDTFESYHHNLFSSVKSRLPRLGSEKGAGTILNFSNNVIYNWTGGQAGYSAFDLDGLKEGKKIGQPSRTNFLANYYVAGPDTGVSDPTFNSASDATQVWQQDDLPNVVDRDLNGRTDGKATGWDFFTGEFKKADARFSVPADDVQTAAEAYEQVLNYSGAFWWKRDAIDARIVNDTRTFRGKNIRYAEDVGGWLNQAEVKRSADFDTDNDGMPDAWEIAHGLDPNKDDAQSDYNGDGYTNIEKYCHEIAAFPAPRPMVYAAKAGRFEDTQNWAGQWKPSQYDLAKLPKGAEVSVDTLGVAAGTIEVEDGAALHLKGGSTTTSHVVLRPGSKADFTGGRLNVNNIEGSFTVAGGTLSPGVTGIGNLQVNGDLTIRSGTLVIQLEGKDLNDRLDIKGDLHLGGEVKFDFVKNYKPAAGAKHLLGMVKHYEGTPKLPEGWTIETKEEKATQNPFFYVYLVGPK